MFFPIFILKYLIKFCYVCYVAVCYVAVRKVSTSFLWLWSILDGLFKKARSVTQRKTQIAGETHLVGNIRGGDVLG